MSSKKVYYWIKIKESFLTSDKVDFLMSQPNGANYIVLYQMLCLKTANNDGVLGRVIGEFLIPYDAKKIARDTKWFSEDTIIVALELYKKLGLIYFAEDLGFYRIDGFENIVGSETNYKEQKQIVRTNKAIKSSSCEKLSSETIRLPNGDVKFVDEKRYGGNGMRAYALANGKCENCGSEENLLIHHNNNFSNNIDDLYILCSKCRELVHSKTLITLNHNRVGQPIGQVLPDIDIEKDIDTKENNKKKKTFVPPTIEEIKAYVEEMDYNVDPTEFFNFYESKNWYVGKNKMSKWKSSVTLWNSKNKDTRKVIKPEWYDKYKNEYEKKLVDKELSEEEKEKILAEANSIFGN